MLKIVTIIGARPQFIKAATVSRAISKHNNSTKPSNQITEILVHTGQHYDDNMSRVFFDELKIPRPDYNLGIGSGSHGKQTDGMLSAIEEVLIQEKPDIVLTYGDTNSTLAGALAASKLHILSAHVEAGLRSYNRKMPEEINRIVADELSNFLFCPTDTAVANLRQEGIGCDHSEVYKGVELDTQLVFNVGDVMYDSILFNKQLAEERSDILHQLGLSNYSNGLNGYCLATIHRPENTDISQNLEGILNALNQIAKTGMRVVLPLHPRTRAKIKEFGFGAKLHFSTYAPKSPSNPTTQVTVINPVGYLDMVQLERYSQAILTDSGGIQKESYLLGVPCITLRKETEWVETLDTGWNTLTGPDTQKILDAFGTISHWDGQGPPFTQSHTQTNPNNPMNPANPNNSVTPFGDGKAAEKIVDIIFKTLT